MKNIIALLLVIFVSSTAVELYYDLFGKDGTSFSKLNTEDDSEKKESEKEDNFEKDKIIFTVSYKEQFILIARSNHSIYQLLLLPNPYISKDINPPNAIV